VNTMRLRSLLAGVALVLSLVGAKMFRVYRAARAEFHHEPWSVGPPPADLRGAEAVSLASRDGSTLRGWWVPPARGATVVLLHGSVSDRRQLLPEAVLLGGRGFGVLMFDWPGLGESGGHTTWSTTEPQALRGALDWIQRRAPGQRIGALGFSRGASILLVTAADDQRLRALVLEAIILDEDEQVRREYAGWGPISGFAARRGMRSAGWDPGSPSPLGVVSRMRGRPLLIVNGTADDVALPSDAQQLFDAAPEPKRLWLIPGLGHGGYPAAAPGQYEETLTSFFRDALEG